MGPLAIPSRPGVYFAYHSVFVSSCNFFSSPWVWVRFYAQDPTPICRVVDCFSRYRPVHNTDSSAGTIFGPSEMGLRWDW